MSESSDRRPLAYRVSSVALVGVLVFGLIPAFSPPAGATSPADQYTDLQRKALEHLTGEIISENEFTVINDGEVPARVTHVVYRTSGGTEWVDVPDINLIPRQSRTLSISPEYRGEYSGLGVVSARGVLYPIYVSGASNNANNATVIAGTTEPGAPVTIIVHSKVRRFEAKADGSGRFKVVIPDLEPGEHSVKVVAGDANRNGVADDPYHGGWRGYAERGETRTVKVGDSVTFNLPLTYDPFDLELSSSSGSLSREYSTRTVPLPKRTYGRRVPDGWETWKPNVSPKVAKKYMNRSGYKVDPRTVRKWRATYYTGLKKNSLTYDTRRAVRTARAQLGRGYGGSRALIDSKIREVPVYKYVVSWYTSHSRSFDDKSAAKNYAYAGGHYDPSVTPSRWKAKWYTLKHHSHVYETESAAKLAAYARGRYNGSVAKVPRYRKMWKVTWKTKASHSKLFERRRGARRFARRVGGSIHSIPRYGRKYKAKKRVRYWDSHHHRKWVGGWRYRYVRKRVKHVRYTRKRVRRIYYTREPVRYYSRYTHRWYTIGYRRVRHVRYTWRRVRHVYYTWKRVKRRYWDPHHHRKWVGGWRHKTKYRWFDSYWKARRWGRVVASKRVRTDTDYRVTWTTTKRHSKTYGSKSDAYRKYYGSKRQSGVTGVHITHYRKRVDTDYRAEWDARNYGSGTYSTKSAASRAVSRSGRHEVYVKPIKWRVSWKEKHVKKYDSRSKALEKKARVGGEVTRKKAGTDYRLEWTTGVKHSRVFDSKSAAKSAAHARGRSNGKVDPVESKVYTIRRAKWKRPVYKRYRTTYSWKPWKSTSTTVRVISKNNYEGSVELSTPSSSEIDSCLADDVVKCSSSCSTILEMTPRSTCHASTHAIVVKGVARNGRDEHVEKADYSLNLSAEKLKPRRFKRRVDWKYEYPKEPTPPQPVTLTVKVDGPGSVRVQSKGSVSADSSLSFDYKKGDTATLTAEWDSSSANWNGWTGDITGDRKAREITLTMESNKSVTAHFSRIKKLTIYEYRWDYQVRKQFDWEDLFSNFGDFLLGKWESISGDEYPKNMYINKYVGQTCTKYIFDVYRFVLKYTGNKKEVPRSDVILHPWYDGIKWVSFKE